MEIYSQKTQTRIFGLDVLRALAILLVLASHLYYVSGSTNPTVISLSGLAGYAGVELFFVLSGFLIGGILLRQFVEEDFTGKKVIVFLKRRWFRTLPNYYLVLIINIAIAEFLGYLPDNWGVYVLFLQNFKTYLISFFTESWSLSIEEWTYVLLPACLFLMANVFKVFSKKGRFLLVVLGLIVLAHVFRYFAFFQQRITTMEAWNAHIKSIVVFRYDTILFGVVLAWIHYYYVNFLKNSRVYLLILALHLFVLQFFVLNVLQVDIISCPVYFHVFYVSLSSFIFFLSLPYFVFWNQGEGIVPKVVVFISKTSYSAYLLHYSIVSVVIQYVLGQMNLPLISILYFGLTFSLSYVLYRFYELPLMRLRDKS